MKKTTALLSALLLTGATAAIAAPATDNNHYQQDKGFYVGAQWLPLQESIGQGSGAGFYPLAGGINVGYQFNRYVALEAGVQGLYEHNSWNFGYGIKGSESDELILPSLAVKGMIPVGSRVNFYGKLGASVAIAHISGTASFDGQDAGGASATNYEFAPFAGVGMGVYLSHHIEFNIDQTMYYLTQDKSGFGMTGVGLTYHF
jgi:hypothetical protein